MTAVPVTLEHCQAPLRPTGSWMSSKRAPSMRLSCPASLMEVVEMEVVEVALMRRNERLEMVVACCGAHPAGQLGLASE